MAEMGQFRVIHWIDTYWWLVGVSERECFTPIRYLGNKANPASEKQPLKW